MGAAVAEKIEIRMISLDDLRPHAVDREEGEMKDVGELAESIKRWGLFNPLLVCLAESDDDDEESEDEVYDIIAGSRRYHAVKSLGWEEVPCIVMDTPDKTGKFESMAVLENLHRTMPNPVRQAKMIKELLDAKAYKSQKALAKDWGVSQPWVSRTLSLLETDEETQEAVAKGELKPTEVVEATRKSRKASGETSRGRGARTKGAGKKVSKAEVAPRTVFKRVPNEHLTPEEGERDESLSILVGEDRVKFSIDVPINKARGKTGIAAYIAKQLEAVGEDSLKKAIKNIHRQEFS